MRIGTVIGEDFRFAPVAPVAIETSTGDPVEFVAIVDTGFNGALSLNDELARDCGLPRFEEVQSTLADGSSTSTTIYAGNVFFANEWRHIPIHGMGDVALVGMQLLWAARLTVDVVIDGPVSLEFFGNRRFRLADPPR